VTPLRSNSTEIAELINIQFIEEELTKKLLYFFIVNEVLIRSKDKGKEFVHSFGDLILSWVEHFIK